MQNIYFMNKRLDKWIFISRFISTVVVVLFVIINLKTLHVKQRDDWYQLVYFNFYFIFILLIPIVSLFTKSIIFNKIFIVLNIFMVGKLLWFLMLS